MNINEPRRKVGITSSKHVSQVCDFLPSNEGRQSMIYWLIRAYGIDSECDHVIPIEKATESALKKFHDDKFIDALLERRDDLDNDVEDADRLKSARKSRHYIDHHILKRKNASGPVVQDIGDFIAQKVLDGQIDESEVEESTDEEAHEQDVQSTSEVLKVSDKDLEVFGLSYDCVVFPFLSDYVQLVAGSTISTANFLISNSKNEEKRQVLGINWYGGRHHCLKSRASGFCYVNDVVLGINTLRSYFPKVFYLDLDLHHGDGVETAFKFSTKVVTCSIHRYDIGFYPGTGSETKRGKYINIPTKRGLSDEGLNCILNDIVLPIVEDFSPSVVVLQLGSDGLALDEHKQWNLTIKGFARNVEMIIENLPCPVMVLGGGGYNHCETAKFCAYMTNSLLNTPLPVFAELEAESDLIPDHPSLDCYEKSGYKFWTDKNVVATKMKDENDKEYLNEMKTQVLTEWFD